MKIKAIFWDNDGVLVDTEKLYFEATRTVLLPLGIELTTEMFSDLFLSKGIGAFHLAKDKGLSEAEIDRLREERNSIYSKLLQESNFMLDDIMDVLTSLHGKYMMGIVTSAKREHFNIIHNKTGLLKYFNFVLTRENYRNSKPDPEPYILAVRKSGFNEKECLAIEDTERGLTSAKMAGIYCYAVPNELSKSNDFSKADRILYNIKEILQYL